MRPLNDNDSKQLFYSRVFGLGNACPQPFEEPSEKILQKCGGLPLAIISIASLLASQSNTSSLDQWNYVFHFQAEAMPKVETLSFRLDVQQVQTCGVVGLHGIEHLPHLKKVYINLCDGRYPYCRNPNREELVGIVRPVVSSFFEQHHPEGTTIRVFLL